MSEGDRLVTGYGRHGRSGQLPRLIQIILQPKSGYLICFSRFQQIHNH
jgi:hypothetical protein